MSSDSLAVRVAVLIEVEAHCHAGIAREPFLQLRSELPRGARGDDRAQRARLECVRPGPIDREVLLPKEPPERRSRQLINSCDLHPDPPLSLGKSVSHFP